MQAESISDLHTFKFNTMPIWSIKFVTKQHINTYYFGEEWNPYTARSEGLQAP